MAKSPVIRDLTQGPILKHLIDVAVPIAIGMLVQTLYVLIDLYFVSRLGGDAVAGVSAGNIVFFIVMGLTQMVSVATLALMSQAIGAKQLERASLIFNQSFLIAAVLALATLGFGYLFAHALMGSLGADAAIQTNGTTYLYWYLPGLALQFAIATIGSALRAAGITQPTMMVQIVSVVCNMILAPVLIAGWGTGHAMGVAGAGLASSISIAIGVVLILIYFIRAETYVHISPDLIRPQWARWAEMGKIGMPSGGEFVLIALTTSVTYLVLRPFGPDAQAGYAIGGRVMQMMFLPAMAISFAVPAIAGQNFGARNAQRVRDTFGHAIRIESVIMLLMTLLCQISPEFLIGLFTTEPAVISDGALFLRIISLNFIGAGVAFACSGMFQAMGNTLPSLGSSAFRLLTFVAPIVWLSHLKGFQIVYIWWAAVISGMVQAAMSVLLVRWQMNKRLAGFVTSN